MKINFKYPDILKMKKESGRKLFFIFVAVAIFVFRLTGDLILHYLEYQITNLEYFWKLITSGALYANIILIAFFPFDNFFKISNYKKEDEDFFNDLYKAIIFLVLSLFLSLFYGFSRVSGNDETLLTLIFGNILVVFIFSTVLYIAKVTKNWLLFRRTSNTNSNIKRIITLGISAIALVLLSKWVNSDLILPLTFIKFLFIIAAAIMLWQIAGRNDWIYYNSKKSKLRLFWLSGALSLLHFIALILMLNSDSNLFFALDNFSDLAQNAVLFLTFLNMVFIVRIWFASVRSLPNADIVERKNSELSSLAYLNQFVTESVDKDIDHLLSTVTDLAVRSSRATGGWCETYSKGNGSENIKVIAKFNFNEEEILKLHQTEHLSSFFREVTEPRLIQSVSEEKNLAPLDLYSKKSRASLIIPILSGDFRLGTIVLTNLYEFGFDANDLMMMTAFSANMKIALENAELMKDSIEKEKYKSELLLARNIQQKLLPQKLPKVAHYSISAFNMPATEVGGDYYDIVKLSNGDFCIVIADVSGKGISAAFYMAQLKGVVLAVASTCTSPKELLSKVNATLYGNMEKSMYITMSAIRLSNNGVDSDFARAGHMPFIIKHNNTVETLIPKGLGIGLSSAARFDKYLERAEIKLNHGDAVLLFTDGINELRLDHDEEFGYEPLYEIIAKEHEFADDMIEDIKNEIIAQKGMIAGHDDMTLVAIINKNGTIEKTE